MLLTTKSTVLECTRYSDKLFKKMKTRVFCVNG